MVIGNIILATSAWRTLPWIFLFHRVFFVLFCWIPSKEDGVLADVLNKKYSVNVYRYLVFFLRYNRCCRDIADKVIRAALDASFCQY